MPKPLPLPSAESVRLEAAHALSSEIESMTDRQEKDRLDARNAHDTHVRLVKQARVSLDAALQEMKLLYRFQPSPCLAELGSPTCPLSESIVNLQQAIMWLGMELKRVGTPTPYPNSYKPENAVVDKTADGLKL